MLDFQESHRQRIVVSADDFGVSQRGNRNTLYLITLGKINRVGIMVDGEISPSEIKDLSRSGVKLDIHLDIPHKLAVDRAERRSVPLKILEFLGKILIGKISATKVQLDWERQIEKFHTMFGRYPDGVNSHEHIHLFPPYFTITLNLQEKYSIPYIRFGDSIKMRHRTTIAYILHVLKMINRKACDASNCVSSNSLVSLDWIRDVDAFLGNLPDGTTEIACHPELAEDFVKIKKYF